MASTLLLSALLSVAAAQTTTVTLPFILGDPMDLTASVVSANPTATTYSLFCGTPTNKEVRDCGLFPTHQLIYGPSTYMMNMGDPRGAAVFTGTVDCVNMAKPTITCKESNGGSEANFPGSSSTELAGSDVTSVKVVVTAGADKLKAAAATSAPASASASPTGSAAAAQNSASGSPAPAPASSKGSADANSVVLGGGFFGATVAFLGGLIL